MRGAEGPRGRATEGPRGRGGARPLRALSRLLDLLAVAAVLFAMATTTPLGGWLVERGRRALGKPPAPQGLARWFRTGVEVPAGAIGIRPEVLGEAPRADAPETVLADRVGLRPALARGILVMAAGGRADAEGHLAVSVPAAAAAALAEVGLSAAPPRAGSSLTPEQSSALLIEAVARLAPRLGGEAPAVAALVIGPEAVRTAVVRARVLAVADPASWDGFGRQLGDRDRRRAGAWVRGALALATAYELRDPLAEPARVSSSFGPRVHPVLGTRRAHTGVDLAVPTGTAILAVGPGTVAHAGEDSVNGKFLRLDHGHGLTSAYCHASALSVEKHDAVAAGAVIARSGNTGRSTGPHLHFQLELDGVPVDPALFLRGLRRAPALSAR